MRTLHTPSQAEDGGGGKRDRNPDRGGRQQVQVFQCVSLSPLRMCRQLSPSRSGPDCSGQVLDTPVVNRERPGILCLEAAAPVP